MPFRVNKTAGQDRLDPPLGGGLPVQTTGHTSKQHLQRCAHADAQQRHRVCNPAIEVDDDACRGMKLLTHNMLACHIKGVQKGFPFKIEATKVDEVDADYDPDFLRRMFPRLEWSALREAAQAMGALHACMHAQQTRMA